MKSYFVSWEMEDVLAESPAKAAMRARAAQRKADSRATVFRVFSEAEGDWMTVDLTQIAEEDEANLSN